MSKRAALLPKKDSSPNQAVLVFVSISMLWGLEIAVGTANSTTVARKASSERSTCFTLLKSCGSASGLKYGESGPKYFSNAALIPSSVAGEELAKGSSIVPLTMAGKNPFHSQAVFPLLFRRVGNP